jgi:hypothetical protein
LILIVVVVVVVVIALFHWWIHQPRQLLQLMPVDQ